MLFPNSATTIPEIYSSCPYPRNITLKNLSYFWWAPTLVYQPVYPRTDRIRWGFFFKRMSEFAVLSMFIWIASAQYAAPVLRNSLEKIQTLNITSILERIMKLSTISLVIWLAGFFALFQSLLNALAEVTRFGDREFYTDWWNSASVGTVGLLILPLDVVSILTRQCCSIGEPGISPSINSCVGISTRHL